MKQNLDWYMNRARENNGLKSDRQLAVRLGMSNIGQWRRPERHDVPSMEAMLKLAKLAKVPPEMALVHRDLWEATYKTPEAVPIFKKILKSLPQYAATLLMACLLYGADFDTGAIAKENSTATNGPSAVPAYKLCA